MRTSIAGLFNANRSNVCHGISCVLAAGVMGSVIVLSSHAYSDTVPAEFNSARATAALKPLSLDGNQAQTNELVDYLKYYKLTFADTIRYSGTFQSGEKTLAAHVFVPRNSRAVVFLLHGYYDHTGIQRNIIAHLLSENFTVVIYDQPGHGLSDGKRASIDNFDEYLMVFRDFVNIITCQLPGPYHVVAHSMGCSPVIEHLLNGNSDCIQRIVLIAPLIRSAAWHIAGIGNAAAGLFVDSVPRVFRKNSSDRDFLTFLKNDPLQTKHVPTKWICALRTWNKKIEAYSGSPRKMLVIQGTKDTTVAWRHNMQFISVKFPNAKIIFVEEGGHQLINESSAIRNRIFRMISGYLNKPE
ncbi:MAG: alpha/beta hydrolase [Lentisphaerae bacterium]|nr:alpha/beta hydrolase [Lentisphaerota bacterium]